MIEEFINENDIIQITLIRAKNTEIFEDYIYLYHLTSENDDIFQKIIISRKYISVDFYFLLDSYKSISVLPHANRITILNDMMTEENIIDVLNKTINLQKLIIDSVYTSENEIINKLHEKKLLNNIEIIFTIPIDVDKIYQIMKIKSLDTLGLREHLYNNGYLSLEKILKVLCHIVDNLNKNIKIELNCYLYHTTLQKYLSLITYNFKVDNFDYIFTYISPEFRKFDNLYDCNLRYGTIFL